MPTNPLFPIIVTQGDPHGIGPEIILKGIPEKHFSSILVLGSYDVFCYYQALLQLSTPLNKLSSIGSHLKENSLNILDIPYQMDALMPGTLSQTAGNHAVACLDSAIQLIKNNDSSILLTAPIHKEAIQLTNPNFIGHTEYLAQKFDIHQVTMSLQSKKIKVALVTTHIALNQVSPQINLANILKTIENCHDFLQTAHLENQKIAVCALNPHAGEGGHFGNEEITIIKPAIEKAIAAGIDVAGPFSADTLFCEVNNNTYGIYIAMYHDQGLIPFKLLSFGKGVNITLGLPFLRVSVDHGTAFNIAGKGIASTGSFNEALSFAISYS